MPSTSGRRRRAKVSKPNTGSSSTKVPGRKCRKVVSNGDIVTPATARRGALRASTIAQRTSEVATIPAESPSTPTETTSSRVEGSSSRDKSFSNYGEAPSLCFYDAASRLKENTISEDEYLHALLAHCTGLRHGENQLCNNDAPPFESWTADRIQRDWRLLYAKDLRRVDNFASKIAEFIAQVVIIEGNPVHDTAPILEVLKAFRADDEMAFRAGLARMDETYWKPPERPGGGQRMSGGLCHYLGLVAIADKKIGVLKAILEVDHKNCGLMFEWAYDDLKRSPKTNRELLRIIDESGFKSIVPPGKTFSSLTMEYWAAD